MPTLQEYNAVIPRSKCKTCNCKNTFQTLKVSYILLVITHRYEWRTGNYYNRYCKLEFINSRFELRGPRGTITIGSHSKNIVRGYCITHCTYTDVLEDTCPITTYSRPDEDLSKDVPILDSIHLSQGIRTKRIGKTQVILNPSTGPKCKITQLVIKAQY